MKMRTIDAFVMRVILHTDTINNLPVCKPHNSWSIKAINSGPQKPTLNIIMQIFVKLVKERKKPFIDISGKNITVVQFQPGTMSTTLIKTHSTIILKILSWLKGHLTAVRIKFKDGVTPNTNLPIREVWKKREIRLESGISQKKPSHFISHSVNYLGRIGGSLREFVFIAERNFNHLLKRNIVKTNVTRTTDTLLEKILKPGFVGTARKNLRLGKTNLLDVVPSLVRVNCGSQPTLQ
jgi:hypothetical protein